MLCALIMAGGKGTRFWPLSTEEKPKQFLNLIGENTMIQMTINRIKPIIPMERIFVCTGEMYVNLVKEQIPDLPERNIVVEPEGRNTAPCIALSAMVIDRYYKNANMVVYFRSLNKDEDEFRNTILAAHNFINDKDEAIVTLGMNPTRPEVGYGYIKYSDETLKSNGFRVIKVESFVEKPNLDTAKKYLREGNYLWNGGMFIWSINNIINQIKIYSPDIYNSLINIKEVSENKLQESINKSYENTESTSIDYAVLEKSKDVYVIPSNFGWDDVGNWEALDRYRDKDEAGNVLVGKSKAIKANNNLVISSNNSVVVDGLNDIYIIEVMESFSWTKV